jgi:phage-related minor tail protein
VLDLGTLVGKLELDGDKFDASLDALPEKFKGKGLLLAGAAGIAATGISMALAKGIDTGLDMQDAGNKAMAELGLTQAESSRIGKMAGSLYSQAYGESIQDVSGVITDVVSSIDGMRTASDSTVEAMTAKVLNFNSTFEVDTGRVTQLVGQMLKTGLAGDADEAMDLLTASMQRVPKAVREDVLDATDEYGPFFKQLGMSGSEAMQALVEGSKTGMYGIDKTGDALKELTIRSSDMSTTSVASYKAAGLNAQEMADKFLKGGDTAKGALSELVRGLQGIDDPAAQANAAIGLFGTPLEDLGTGKIPQFLDGLANMEGGMGDIAGSADKMGAAINGGARVGWEQLTRTFETTVGVIGQQLAPMLTDLIGWLNKNPEILKLVVFGVLGLAVAFGVLTAAMWAASLTPVALIIAGIVAAVALLAAGVYLLVTHWDEVVSFLQGVGAAVWTWLQGVIQGFVDWWNGIWAGFGGMVEDAWSGVQSFLDGIGAWWSGLWAGFGGMLADGWNAVLAYLAGLPGQILAGLAILGQGILDGLAALPGLLYEGLTTAIALGLAALYVQFVVLPQQIASWLVGAGTWLLQTGIDLLTGLANGITAGAQAVWAFLLALPGRIVSFIIVFGTLLVTWGATLLRGLADGITTGAQAVWAFLLALPGRVVSFVVGFASLLITWGMALLSGLANGITSGASAVWSFMSALPGRLVGYAASLGGLLISRGSAMLNGLASGISAGAGAVWSFMSGLPGRIVSAAGNLAGALIGAGGDLMRGLLSGIRNGLGSILSAISGMAGDIMSKFKSILGIHSPSTVFAGYGMNIGQGLIDGLAGMQGDVDAQVAGLVSIPRSTVRVGFDGTGLGGDDGLGGLGGLRGVTVDARMFIEHAGWTREELEAEQSARLNRNMALAGLNEEEVA